MQAWHVHPLLGVTFLERRKGFGTASMDRRKSYVDVLERVLGNLFPSTGGRVRSFFLSDVKARRSTVSSTVSEIQVFMLDSRDERHH
jgi:hypothetical protein